MAQVVGVRFKKIGKIYYFDPKDLEIELYDKVIVETSRGVEMGELVIDKKTIEDDDVVTPLKDVIRVATESDIKNHEKNKQKEKEAFRLCLEKIKEHDLDMKLVDVEYTFDNSKIIFCFTAEGRIDFRELVKDLASAFKTRIELRQIGIRDEAKQVGGIGPCGRALCCNTFLGDFEPVSIKAAKIQNLALNPVKISGICNKLMCCLNYEAKTYALERKGMPSEGSMVMTDKGEGKVREVDPLKKRLFIELKESGTREYMPLSATWPKGEEKPHCGGGDCDNCPKNGDKTALIDLDTGNMDDDLTILEKREEAPPKRSEKSRRRPPTRNNKETGENSDKKETKPNQKPRPKKPRQKMEIGEMLKNMDHQMEGTGFMESAPTETGNSGGDKPKKNRRHRPRRPRPNGPKQEAKGDA